MSGPVLFPVRDTYVKGGVNGGNSYAFPTLTCAGPFEFILVLSDESQDASTISSVTAPGLTFTTPPFQDAFVNKGPGSGNVEVWMAYADFTFSGAITVNFTGTNNPQASGIAVAYKYTNPTGTGLFNASDMNGQGGTSTTPNISLWTQMPNTLVIGCIGSASNNAISAGAGCTVIDTATVVGAAFTELALLEQQSPTITSGTAVSISGTMSSSIWGAQCLSLRGPQVGFTPHFSTKDGMSRSEVAN